MGQLQRFISWIGLALTVGAVILGFMVAGSPQRARDFRADEERVQHLQQIVSSIQSYYDDKNVLPETLETLRTAGRLFGGEAVLRDPITQEAYEYEITGEKTFALCANFALPAQGGRLRGPRIPIPIAPAKVAFVDWNHPAGRHCFAIEVSEPAKSSRE